MSRSKIIQDAVHGMIELDPIAMLIVDTPEFQRLREIRQLGLAYFVYPSCQHTRFEHSIGTYHMARRLMNSIRSDLNYKGPRLSVQEEMEVKIAALCHDLGHGPFSHTWECYIHAGGREFHTYKHEKMSCRILERIVHNNPLLQQHLIEAGVNLEFVKSLILGDQYNVESKFPKKEPFIYEILSNNANGMDVDKWDYLLRDCLHAGMGHGTAAIDLDRFMHFYRPALHPVNEQFTAQPDGEPTHRWHLSFRDTELENVLRTFGLRQYLHQKLYKHKTVTAIAHMVHDALELLESVTHFRAICMRALAAEDPDAMDRFLQLNDTLLWDIYHKRLSRFGGDITGDKVDLASALVRRIFTRDLYTYIDSVFEIHSGQSATASRKNSVESAHKFGHSLRTIVSCVGAREPFLSETLPPDRRIIGPLSIDEDAIANLVDAIYSRLPSDSGIKSKSDLLVAKSSFSSNSTPHAPQFYFYTRNETTFVYEEPLRVVHAYRLYLKREENGRAADGFLSAAKNLFHAFDQWYRDCGGKQILDSLL